MEDVRKYKLGDYDLNYENGEYPLFGFAVSDYRMSLGDIYENNKQLIDSTYITGGIVSKDVGLSETLWKLFVDAGKIDIDNGITSIIVIGFRKEDEADAEFCRTMCVECTALAALFGFEELEHVYDDRLVFVRPKVIYESLLVKKLFKQAKKEDVDNG